MGTAKGAWKEGRGGGRFSGDEGLGKEVWGGAGGGGQRERGQAILVPRAVEPGITLVARNLGESKGVLGTHPGGKIIFRGQVAAEERLGRARTGLREVLGFWGAGGNEGKKCWCQEPWSPESHWWQEMLGIAMGPGKKAVEPGNTSGKGARRHDVFSGQGAEKKFLGEQGRGPGGDKG